MNYLKAFFTHTHGLLTKKSCKVNLAFKFIDQKHLFTHTSLGITTFKENRQNCLRSIPNQQKFKSQMAENCTANDSYMVFSDDLKKMMRIAESDEDLMTLQKMIIRFNSQANTVRFQSFHFGPEILRLYYILNKPVEAMAFFENKDMYDMFNSTKCYVLLLNLLFENEMYNEVVKMYKMYSKNELKNPFSFGVITIFLGACYKLNTAESYEDAVNLLGKFAEVNYKCPLRALYFASILALNQNHSYQALELVSSAPPLPIITNIKAMSLAKEKRYDDAIHTINHFLFMRSQVHGFILNDTLKFLENEFQGSDEEQLKSFQKIKKDVIAHNFIKFESLDNVLCEKMWYKTLKGATQEHSSARI